MVVGAVVSSAVALWAGGRGVPASATAGRRKRVGRLARMLNRAFVLCAIACTPLVNFRLLGGYRPSTFYPSSDERGDAMDMLKTAATAMGRVLLAEVMAGSNSLFFVVGALAGWAIERRTLRARRLAKEARAMVTLKDALIVGAAASRLTERALPTGGRAQRGAKLAHEVLVAAAVAATPFINFALFLDYRPAGSHGVLKLWA
jgi:hypothetical protein